MERPRARGGWKRWTLGLACGIGTAVCAATNEDLPPVSIRQAGKDLHITFEGQLQWARDLTGPWTPLTNALSPFTVTLNPTEAAARFFRATAPTANGVFNASTELRMSLSGPLQQHFELAYAGLPDGIFPPKREKPYFDATLHLGSLNLPVRARVRGNSSLQECPFPKLKFKVAKEDRLGTPFETAREIKIGTHCADAGRGPVGRLRDERATVREALAYETMTLLGFVSPKVRRARLDYADNTPGEPESAVGWNVSRKALILEDIEVLAERLGGRVLTEDEIAALTPGTFATPLVAELQLLHALLGNWDYSLAIQERGVWNTEVLEFADGRKLPVAGDFDLASWVTGVVRGQAPRDYHPELADVEREARFQVERIRGTVDAAVFAAATNRYLERRSALEHWVATADVDDEGRANAGRHLQAFFEALEALR